MARQSAFDVRIDVSQVEDLAGKLNALTPQQVGRLMVDAINETLDSTYALGVRRMLSGINLTNEYVQKRLRVDQATDKRPVGTITAPGDRKNLTGLSHYGAMTLQGATKRLAGRIGTRALGIPAGKKRVGRSVEVVKGQRKVMPNAFAMVKKGGETPYTDSSGTPLVFMRFGGSIKALHGPSVYQLFRVAAADIAPQVADELERAVVETAAAQISKALT